jgi:hypothetical protein
MKQAHPYRNLVKDGGEFFLLGKDGLVLNLGTNKRRAMREHHWQRLNHASDYALDIEKRKQAQYLKRKYSGGGLI